MNGTLALWYEDREISQERGSADGSADDRKPHLRLHVNLWRDTDRNLNFLDIGLLLDSHYSRVGRIYLYLPTQIESGSIFDLSTALKDGETLNAVFNEVMITVGEADDYFVVKTGKGTTRAIHKLNIEQDVSVDAVSVPGRSGGTIIALNNSVLDRVSKAYPSAGEHYIRIRLFLKKISRELFTTVDKTVNYGLSLTHDVIETTEFRLNERRSYPPDVLYRASRGVFSIRSIHYFLIRDRNLQLSNQHQTFNKIRNLEKDIWTTYISAGHTFKEREARHVADGMTIYQWREIVDQNAKGIDDFIAYASFRTTKPNYWTYLIAVLVIGGVGSAALNIALAVIGPTPPSTEPQPASIIWLNLSAAILLSGFALLPALWTLPAWAWKRWGPSDGWPFRRR